MVITMLLVIGLTCLPILYSSQNDLKVILLDDRMEISGLYGLDIPLCKNKWGEIMPIASQN